MVIKKIGKAENYIFIEAFSNFIPGNVGFSVQGSSYIFSSFLFGIKTIEIVAQARQNNYLQPELDFKFYDHEWDKVKKLWHDSKGDPLKYASGEKLNFITKLLTSFRQEANNKPLRLAQYKKTKDNEYKHGDLIFCLYKDNIYKLDRTDYSDQEIVLRIMELEDNERREFERLKHRFSEAEKTEKDKKRQPIPEEVRIAVWRRDEGKCVKCGSRENLEYDHIIPLSKDGSNTVRNIELLCEKCNKEKMDNIQ